MICSNWINRRFEVFCILFFYENMCGLLRLNNFLDGTNKFILAVPPCCCCLRFLIPAPATEYDPFIKIAAHVLLLVIIYHSLIANHQTTLVVFGAYKSSLFRLTVFRLRIGIVVTIIFQTILQFVRTMRIFECQYKPDSIVGSGSNILSSVSFLFAMWGLIVVYKSGKYIIGHF